MATWAQRSAARVKVGRHVTVRVNGRPRTCKVTVEAGTVTAVHSTSGETFAGLTLWSPAAPTTWTDKYKPY